ncbi:ATP-binding protein [Azospirillum picis]|uniref:histidine kinase n=1 Tax=Azospirillum picis TaxID=488438 RepID=A0ABU0MSH9_9PROT|nr:ATP-binding protein [Azospirillum picis]MBP2301993.1 PAS domain S-box-containing protein [Azospirillum picis]MDQ0536442.1 PAS domain S-box-containing protein [Azospirillum picis]
MTDFGEPDIGLSTKELGGGRRRISWPQPVATLRLGLLAAVIAGFWLVAYADLMRTRDRALQDGLRQTRNLSRLLAEDAQNSLALAGQSLGRLALAAAHPSPIPGLDPDWDPVLDPGLNRGSGSGPVLSGLLIGDEDGRLRWSTEAGPVGGAVAPAVTDALRQLAPSGAPILSAPFRTEGGWRAALVRRLDNHRGFVAAIIDLGRFSRLYGSQDIGLRSNILLYGEEGTVLAFASQSASNLDNDRGYYSRIVPRLPDGVEMESRSGVDRTANQERIGTVRRVAGWPLYVYVRISADDVLAGWYSDRWKRVLETAAVSLALGLLAVLALRQLGRLEAATRALRESERRSQALFDSSFQVMGLLSPDGRILALNQSACALAGLPAEALVGLRAWKVHGWVRSDELAAAFRDSIAKAASGRIVRYETDLLDEAGMRVMDVSIKPVADDAGAVALLVVEARDITERVEAAARLAAAKEQAEAANRSKSAFLATMSHELRTPLNAIIGFSEIMLHELFGPLGSPRYHDYARHVQSSGRHLLDLINDVLDMSKLEAGRYALDESWLAPVEVIESCRSLSAVPAEAGGVVLAVDCPVDLPRLRADERALRQVLLNLLSNAVKFTPRGGSVTVTAAVEAGGGLAVTVRDTGIGIPADALARILEPFQQADSSIPRRFGGTGLGLSICRDLMALHDGSLSIDSEPGKGTAVTVRFPAERVADAVAGAALQA